MSRILVLSEGRVAALGTYEQLRANGSLDWAAGIHGRQDFAEQVETDYEDERDVPSWGSSKDSVEVGR